MILVFRGAFLEQKKEPTLSSDIELLDTPDYVYIPLPPHRQDITRKKLH